MSLRASTFSPRACSGDMYSGVPDTVVPPLEIAFAPARLDRGHAEVAHLRHVDEIAVVVALLGEDDVLGLDVAVDDALLVRGAEGRADLGHDVDDARQGERLLLVED